MSDQRAETQRDAARMVAEKPCCTICDAQKRCHVCSRQTLFACADCRIDLGVSVYVCPSRSCRDEHEHKCGAWLRYQLREADTARLALQQQVEDSQRALIKVVAIAKEALADWDADRDSRVGKILAALAGHLPRYRADIDAIHAALLPPLPETKDGA